ncbi:MAG TPA: hypothetical protein VHH13_08345 [Arthrobacter sp.]|nr:hypothetical protein [Arthrobacter sp.]
MINEETSAGVRRDKRRLPTLMLLCLLVAAVGLGFAPAANAAPNKGGGKTDSGGGTDLLGNDVSWPQCNKALPENPAFAIVGVTGGLANNTNPCLAEQLAWAEEETLTDATGQPDVALYVNTANAGHTGSWWPDSNEYSGVVVDNPYGDCSGAEDAACAYMYGWAKAYDDANIRGISNPEDYLWWLDVETENSWSTDKVANAADLEGMTDYFESIGADVGIYSTNYQWGQIVGQVSADSSLAGLPSWLAGARTANGAKNNCSSPPLTPGGYVSVTQFVSRGFDYDYSCV